MAKRRAQRTLVQIGFVVTIIGMVELRQRDPLTPLLLFGRG